MPKRSLAVAVTLIALAAYPGMAAAQENASDAATLIDVLQLAPGSVVAEVGAGGGELTLALAKHVGPGGRVISSELGSDRVQRLRRAVEKGPGNIEVIGGNENRTNFPDACCDAIFMRNVYHHFGDPAAMNASLLRGLKPGGRIAIIDFPPRGNRAAPSGTTRGGDSSHGVGMETVAADLKAAGFQILKSEERTSRWFIVIGVKPAS